MSNTQEKLTSLFESIPPDLISYFDGSAVTALCGHENVGVNLLRVDEAVRWSADFRTFHPIVNVLGGVILDDANTSNHHVYLSLEPCGGSILFLDHDGESKIVFPSLPAFAAAASSAIREDRYLNDYHPDQGVLLYDQIALSRLVNDLHEGRYNCDSTGVITALVPSMDLRDFELLARLAADSDLYLAEAIGDAIARRPERELKPLAKLCEEHPHAQASRAGARALKAIAAIR